jgi:hypothetical protein
MKVIVTPRPAFVLGLVGLLVATLGFADPSRTRIGGPGSLGKYLDLGEYPKARGVFWTPASGIGRASSALQLATDFVSLEEVRILQDALRRGVKVELLVYRELSPDDRARQGAESQDALLATLAASGAVVFLAQEVREPPPTFALIDEETLILPAPIRRNASVRTFTAMVVDGGLGRLFHDHFRKQVERASAVDPADLTAHAPQGTVSQREPPEPPRPAGGTIGVSSASRVPTDVYAVRAPDDLDAVLATATPEHFQDVGDLRMYAYVEAAHFSKGEQHETFVRIMAPLRKRYGSRVSSVRTIVENAIDSTTFETWLRSAFPTATVEVLEERDPVRTAFVLHDSQAGQRGFAFIGSLTGGVVILGQTPTASSFSARERLPHPDLHEGGGRP